VLGCIRGFSDALVAGPTVNKASARAAGIGRRRMNERFAA
jgi:hypothetical protein